MNVSQAHELTVILKMKEKKMKDGFLYLNLSELNLLDSIGPDQSCFHLIFSPNQI